MLRPVAFLLLISVTLINIFDPSFSYAGTLGAINFPDHEIQQVDPRAVMDTLKIPEEIGSIREVFFPEENAQTKLIFYLQSAHTNFDSESNTRKIIELFEIEHHLPFVFLEGGEGRLDSLFFKSFPNTELKEKVLRDYLKRGDLSGGEVASILDEVNGTQFYGIENQALYQENKAAFLAANEKEEEILKQLDDIDLRMQKSAVKRFTEDVKMFHEQGKAFRREEIDLIEYLKSLETLFKENQKRILAKGSGQASLRGGDQSIAEAISGREIASVHTLDAGLAMTRGTMASALVRSAPRNKVVQVSNGLIIQTGTSRTFQASYPELQKLLKAESAEKHLKSSEVDIAASGMINEFKEKILPKLPKFRQMEMNRLIQMYRIGHLSAGLLTQRIKSVAQEQNFFFEVPRALAPGARQARTLASIKGTKLFEELRVLESDLRALLPQSDEERSLLEDFHHLELLRNFAKLELERDDWNTLRDKRPSDIHSAFSVTAMRNTRSSSRGGVPRVAEAISDRQIASSLLGSLPRNDGVLDSLFASHYEFYRLAEQRDAVLLDNALKRMEKEKSKLALIATGGFHTEGITKKLKEKKIPYVLIAPKINELGDRENYLNVMRGKRSFMAYFNGSLWDALAQDYTAKLAESLNEYELTPSLKKWRDRIIQNAIAEGRVTQASRYTKYVDALVQALRKEYEKDTPFGGDRRADFNLPYDRENELRKRLERELNACYSTYFDKLEALLKQRLEIFGDGLKQMWGSGAITPDSIARLIDRMHQAPRSTIATDLALVHGATERGEPRTATDVVRDVSATIVEKINSGEFTVDDLYAARAELRVVGLNPITKFLVNQGIGDDIRALNILDRVGERIGDGDVRSAAEVATSEADSFAQIALRRAEGRITDEDLKNLERAAPSDMRDMVEKIAAARLELLNFESQVKVMADVISLNGLKRTSTLSELGFHDDITLEEHLRELNQTSRDLDRTIRRLDKQIERRSVEIALKRILQLGEITTPEMDIVKKLEAAILSMVNQKAELTKKLKPIRKEAAFMGVDVMTASNRAEARSSDYIVMEVTSGAGLSEHRAEVRGAVTQKELETLLRVFQNMPADEIGFENGWYWFEKDGAYYEFRLTEKGGLEIGIKPQQRHRISILKVATRFLSDLVRKGWLEAARGLSDNFKTLYRHRQRVFKELVFDARGWLHVTSQFKGDRSYLTWFFQAFRALIWEKSLYRPERLESLKQQLEHVGKTLRKIGDELAYQLPLSMFPGWGTRDDASESGLLQGLQEIHANNLRSIFGKIHQAYNKRDERYSAVPSFADTDLEQLRRWVEEIEGIFSDHTNKPAIAAERERLDRIQNELNALRDDIQNVFQPQARTIRQRYYELYELPSKTFGSLENFFEFSGAQFIIRQFSRLPRSEIRKHGLEAPVRGLRPRPEHRQEGDVFRAEVWESEAEKNVFLAELSRVREKAVKKAVRDVQKNSNLVYIIELIDALTREVQEIENFSGEDPRTQALFDEWRSRLLLDQAFISLVTAKEPFLKKLIGSGPRAEVRSANKEASFFFYEIAKALKRVRVNESAPNVQKLLEETIQWVNSVKPPDLESKLVADQDRTAQHLLEVLAFGREWHIQTMAAAISNDRNLENIEAIDNAFEAFRKFLRRQYPKALPLRTVDTVRRVKGYLYLFREEPAAFRPELVGRSDLNMREWIDSVIKAQAFTLRIKFDQGHLKKNENPETYLNSLPPHYRVKSVSVRRLPAREVTVTFEQREPSRGELRLADVLGERSVDRKRLEELADRLEGQRQNARPIEEVIAEIAHPIVGDFGKLRTQVSQEGTENILALTTPGETSPSLLPSPPERGRGENLVTVTGILRQVSARYELPFDSIYSESPELQQAVEAVVALLNERAGIPARETEPISKASADLGRALFDAIIGMNQSTVFFHTVSDEEYDRIENPQAVIEKWAEAAGAAVTANANIAIALTLPRQALGYVIREVNESSPFIAVQRGNTVWFFHKANAHYLDQMFAQPTMMVALSRAQVEAPVLLTDRHADHTPISYNGIENETALAELLITALGAVSLAERTKEFLDQYDEQSWRLKSEADRRALAFVVLHMLTAYARTQSLKAQAA